jgi:outer membrane protein OmpA-like peptidoglycan-associated protein
MLKSLALQVIFISGLVFEANAQDGVKRKLPLAVSHLPSSNRAILRMKNASRHNILNKVLCFQVSCRRAIGWQASQRQRRFNGYKNVPQVRDAKRGKTQGPVRPSIQTQPQKASQPDTLQSKSVVAPHAIEPVAERKFVLSDVLFDHNSPALKKDFTSQLDTLVDILQKNQSLQVMIIGHTDNTGREAYNIRLSTSRAEAVGLYLIDKGIVQSRIGFAGRGSSQPIADNASEEGRQKNRRVEIILTE